MIADYLILHVETIADNSLILKSENNFQVAQSYCRNRSFDMMMEKQTERYVVLISICQLYNQNVLTTITSVHNNLDCKDHI